MNLKTLPNLKENVPLSRYTTFRLGGPARYFIEAKRREDLVAVLDWARQEKQRYVLIGGGSNVLFLDSGFDGLVIKNSASKIKITGTRLAVDSGTILHTVVTAACQNHLAGLEGLSWIPGSVGGAIYGNAGAYGQDIGRMVESVDAYDVVGRQKISLPAAECGFAYRHSVFKEKTNLVILGAVLRLAAGPTAALSAQCEKIKQERQNKFPLAPSAGCVFQNIPVSAAANNQRLQPFLAKVKGDKIAAGLLIDQADLKGAKIGGAQVSPLHANFIVNSGKATADDVIKLISLIKAKVRDMFGVNLECEVQIIK